MVLDVDGMMRESYIRTDISWERLRVMF